MTRGHYNTYMGSKHISLCWRQGVCIEENLGILINHREHTHNKKGEEQNVWLKPYTCEWDVLILFSDNYDNTLREGSLLRVIMDQISIPWLVNVIRPQTS